MPEDSANPAAVCFKTRRGQASRLLKSVPEGCSGAGATHVVAWHLPGTSPRCLRRNLAEGAQQLVRAPGSRSSLTSASQPNLFASLTTAATPGMHSSMPCSRDAGLPKLSLPTLHQQGLCLAQCVAQTLLPALYAGDVQPNKWLIRAAAPNVHKTRLKNKHPEFFQAAALSSSQTQMLSGQLPSRQMQAANEQAFQSGGAPAERQHQSGQPWEQQQEQALQHTEQQAQQHKQADSWQSAKLLVAGAMSAVVSRTCVAPLERVKMELMLKQGAGGALATASQVFRTEGVKGFWKGNLLNLLRTAPFKAVNFCAFDTLHRLMCEQSGKDGNWERFLSGAFAGMTATVVCFPLDLVRTRLLVRTAKGPYYGPGPFNTLLGIIKHEGPGALYTGCLPAVIGMAPAGAVFYGVYDLLKHRHMDLLAKQQQQQKAEAAQAGTPCEDTSDTLHVPALYTLLYGAMAGASSELIVYPLEVVRRRMQMQSMALAHLAVSTATAGGRAGMLGAAAKAAAHIGQHAGSLQAAAAAHSAMGAPAAAAVHTAAAGAASKGLARVLGTCAAIMKAEGPGGFYAGMGPNMLQVLPSAALSYYTYDTVKQLLGVRM